MLFIHPYKTTFFPYFCFPDAIMYMLNIASAIKTITVNEIVKKQMPCKYQLMTADLSNLPIATVEYWCLTFLIKENI